MEKPDTVAVMEPFIVYSRFVSWNKKERLTSVTPASAVVPEGRWPMVMTGAMTKLYSSNWVPNTGNLRELGSVSTGCW